MPRADHYPDRYLFSDEVGLGKTIECAGSLRYLIMSGRVRRALLLVPRGVLSQWRTELREKFALPFWYYDGTSFYNPYDGTVSPTGAQPWTVPSRIARITCSSVSPCFCASL